jgi:leucyl aminopeptidase
LDIAGTAYYNRPYFSYLGLGASGFGVRTLVQYLQNQVKSS